MKYRVQPNVFSTAFVDLFACGLGGAIVMWLINISDFRLQSIPQPAFVNISLGVYGYDHLPSKPVISNPACTFSDSGMSECVIGDTKLKLLNISDSGVDEDDKTRYARLYQIQSDNIMDGFEIVFRLERCGSSQYHNIEYFVSTPKSSHFTELLFNDQLQRSDSSHPEPKPLNGASYLVETLESYSPADPFSNLKIIDGALDNPATLTVKVQPDGKVETLSISNLIDYIAKEKIVNHIRSGS